MKLRLLPLLALLVLPLPAKADYFVWNDPKSGMSLTFPDMWQRQNNLRPDTIMTVMAPSENDQPVCKVDVRDDKRFVIYPVRYSDPIQKVAVSLPFWKNYLGHYDDYTLDGVYDGAGLGRGFASYALASYTQRFGTTMQTRRAIMFASLYHDKMYVIECSSLNHAYEQWAADFRGVIKSVDFKKANHELPTGEYANFLREAELYFWAQTGPEGTVAY
jgi:hypothetical protein